MNKNKPSVIVMIGPTAVGKTQLSVMLADSLNAEIISGDSMQIYRKMDIGTAKIKAEEMNGVRHHLLDIKDAAEPFSVAEYQQIVREKIAEIEDRGKLPMIVGGTGLYIQSVLYDYSFTEEAGDSKFRAEMERLAVEKGNEYVHSLLKERDAKAAEAIHQNNVRRVIRALEILHTSRKTMSQHIEDQQKELLYNTALVGLTMDRQVLYDRINKRVDQMMDEGLLQEARQFFEDEKVRHSQSVQAIGYKELFAYFEGRETLSAAVETLKRNSRRYAKRQLTWFRNKMDVTWFDMTPPVKIEQKKQEIFTYIAGKIEF
ncbi:tRNA (adenosine(37)-N6)-dimethylallyltransferase MiaA [Bacillus changyiensis]|uniref:tRNA (adenosine(37)-N6)-dimethylallyltransferase MiaA n=1 Tax=Bacillus changyiensis TaxID=3004103 RepID=UPI0022DF028D|nr:tRNA (adenosine(37)-N6)-dimethylallyltransferase MiaA [Bacillus changyiensis]MDA1475436.1 tRNA (adenosine(37)-N6)-dimethylallyltransferase MiaA [Bacillus changyiensis]